MARVGDVDREALGRLERRQWAAEQRANWCRDVVALVAVWDAHVAVCASGLEQPDAGVHTAELAERLEARILAGPRPWPGEDRGER